MKQLDESSLSAGEASPLSLKDHPTSFEEPLMASLEAVAMKESWFSSGHPSTTFLASRLGTTLKSPEVPKGEVQSVTLEEMHYIPNATWVLNLYRKSFVEYM